MKNVCKLPGNAFGISDYINPRLILPDLANTVKTGSSITVKILLV